MSAIDSKPAWALVAGASLWGIVWYPYRLLAQAGLDGRWATALTYGLAFVVGSILFARDLPALRRAPAWALLMGAAIGWSNLAYVLAVLEGEVMRVLLLFYLAPLWTVPLARLLRIRGPVHGCAHLDRDRLERTPHDTERDRVKPAHSTTRSAGAWAATRTTRLAYSSTDASMPGGMS